MALAAAERERSRLQGRAEELQGRLAEAEEGRRAAEAEAEELRGRLEALGKEVAGGSEAAECLRAELEEAARKLEAAEERAAEAPGLREQLESLKAELGSARQDADSSAAGEAGVTAKLAEAEQSAAVARDHIVSLEEEVGCRAPSYSSSSCSSSSFPDPPSTLLPSVFRSPVQNGSSDGTLDNSIVHILCPRILPLYQGFLVTRSHSPRHLSPPSPHHHLLLLPLVCVRFCC